MQLPFACACNVVEARGLPARSPSAPAVDASTITSSEMLVTWSSWLSRNDQLSEEEVFEVQWQRLGSLAWRDAVVTTIRYKCVFVGSGRREVGLAV